MANRLKAGSHEETLTNILEWQERNIAFWTERYYIPTILGQFPLVYAVVLFGSIALAVWLPSLWWPFFWILSAAFIVGIVLTLTIAIWVVRSVRKISLRQGFKNLFVASLPMGFLLVNKLGVCRDYAKLTTSLLSNIYPDAKIYFAHTKTHTATGIVIENRLYMMDERLPILTIDKWNDYRDSKTIQPFSRNVTKPTPSISINSFLSRTKTTSLDTEKIATTMMKALNIKENTVKDGTSLETPITWKKGAIFYEENEMVDYSLARYLATKISDELVRIEQIRGIKTKRHKDDLIFQIRFG